MNINYTLRTEVKESDIQFVEEIVRSTGFFRDDEIEVAVELVQEAFEKGKESGYEFVFVDVDDKTVAYSCFGLIPCTLVSYDLYWIATHNDFRGKGLGKVVLQKTEEIVKFLKGKGIYVETSSKPLYLPTQKFYEKNDYTLKVSFEDFYAEGDDKYVYVKKI
ncbi:MAG: GNAT family N-acetyltransferase [Bacteroidales bacterium]|nr:GNAT family N-acetyltransferase [Bacteroidales bacterium]